MWRLLGKLARAASVPERAVGPLYDAMQGLRIRNASYRASVREAEGVSISDQTASRDLRALVEAELLVAHGERRGRNYTRGSLLRLLDERSEFRGAAPIADPFA